MTTRQLRWIIKHRPDLLICHTLYQVAGLPTKSLEPAFEAALPKRKSKSTRKES